LQGSKFKVTERPTEQQNNMPLEEIIIKSMGVKGRAAHRPMARSSFYVVPRKSSRFS
jgi:hypothetical protein